MRTIHNFGFVALLLAGAGTQLAAQQPAQKGWVAGAALPIAAEGLKQWTNQSIVGLCLDGAYQIPIAESRASFRLGLGVNYLPGKEREVDHRTIGLTGIQANFDVHFPIASSPVSVFTGISLNTWMKSVSGKHPYDQDEDISVSGTVKNAFGKYGLRLGAEYALSKRLSIALTLQLTELGVDSEFLPDKEKLEDWDDIWGENTVHPTWVQIGVRYRF